MKAPLIDKNADAEAILWEVRVVDESSGEHLQSIRSHYLRMKIFTERGREHAKAELTYFNKMSVGSISGRTIKPDGHAVDMKRDAVFDTEVAKSRSLRVRAKTFTLPDVQPGDIIEYQWIESEEDVAANYLQLPLQRDVPVQTVRYLIKPLVVPGYTMRSWLFHADRSPMTQIAGGFTVMEHHNMAAFKTEPDMAPEDEIRAWALIYYADDGERKPDSYWPGVAKRNYAVYQKDIKVNGEAKKAAAEATASAKTEDEKVRAIYAWVRKNVKNVSTEATAEERRGFKENRSSADTLKQGMGTGYDINAAFAALADAAGFDARIALTGNRSQMFFSKSYTDPYFLRGTLVAVKIGGAWKYFDPATSYLPCGFQPWQQQGTLALITDSKSPEWNEVPLSKAADSQESHGAVLKLDAEGNLSGTVEMRYIGHLAVTERRELLRKTAEEREQYLISELKDQFTSPEITEIKWEGIEDSEKPVRVTFHIQLPNYAQRTGKRMFLQPAVFQHGLAARFSAGERSNPVYFHFPWSEVDVIRIQMPEGYALDNADIPQGIRAGETLEWKAEAQIAGGNMLIYQRSFKFGDDGNILMPQKAYPSLKSIFDAIHNNDEHTIALKQAAAK